jgi:hypothetical protein
VKNFTYEINEALLKGLTPAHTRRNAPYLVESIGAVPQDGVLQAIETFEAIDVQDLGIVSFPYPQLFVASDFIVVATETALYELTGVEGPGNLTAKITGLTAGIPWTCLDLKGYLYFTNGKVAITRNSKSGVYTVDLTVPFASAACNFNGQVLLGSPNAPVS